MIVRNAKAFAYMYRHSRTINKQTRRAALRVAFWTIYSAVFRGRQSSALLRKLGLKL